MGLKGELDVGLEVVVVCEVCLLDDEMGFGLGEKVALFEWDED